MDKLAIAGVVILYYPSLSVRENILSYLSDLSFLFVIDNTEKELDRELMSFFEDRKQIRYIKNPANLGVSAALNIGAHAALQSSFNWLLTMDQDSQFGEGDLQNLIQQLTTLNYSKIGIFSPRHIHSKVKINKNDMMPSEEVNMTMTSGNLLNLQIFKEVGDFCEKLFIDHVDHEYCLRLRSMGYKVVQSNLVKLKHELGEMKSVRFAGKTFFKYISHQPLRGYYISRNGLYVMTKYRKTQPFFYSKNIRLLVKEILKVLVFENKKIIRLKFIFKGIRDYKKNRFGKLQLKST